MNSMTEASSTSTPRSARPTPRSRGLSRSQSQLHSHTLQTDTQSPSHPSRIPSCDPCRTSKQACDHGRPVCGRCTRKGSPAQCVYRKDPFRRSTRAERSARRSGLQAQAHAQGQARTPAQATQTAPYTSPREDQDQPPLQLTLYPNPGFQGSSSLNTILDTVEHGAASYDETDGNSGNEDGRSERRTDIDPALDNAQNTTAIDGNDIFSPDAASPLQGTMLVMSGTAMIEEGAQVLELLIPLFTQNILQQLFEEWMGKGLEVHVGSLLVKPFLDSFGRVLESVGESAAVLSRRLFNATKASTDIDSTASLQDFGDRYTGRHLRWETIGLILALAGNAVSKLRAPHPILYRTEAERHTLGRNLLHASNKCASFCEALDILNDVQIIFLYESFLLHSVYFGHQSFRVWGRLNTAINALFGRGIHQRIDKERERQGGPNGVTVNSSAPFFLVELRKHVFALLYSSDINFSVFLGRPPRISKRHCVIHMPLDVNPEAYTLPSTDVPAVLAELNDRGWNALGQIRTHAVIRWSMITSQIREEALEAILGPDRLGQDRNQLINGLRVNIAQAWAELPPFLAVPAQQVWAARRPGQQTDTLYLIRLYYLQTLFLIEWTASVQGTVADNLDALFVVASDLLAWVNEAIIMRERLNRLGLNTLAWRVSAFGLPAAGALAKCLLAADTHRTISTATFSKAIRDLSVLIAHMDYLYDSSDGNDKLFSRAKGILIKVLDSTLSGTKKARQPQNVVRQVPTESPSANLAMFASPPSTDNLDMWEFRPELWIGLPGPNSTEVNHLDFMSDFTNFMD